MSERVVSLIREYKRNGGAEAAPAAEAAPTEAATPTEAVAEAPAEEAAKDS